MNNIITLVFHTNACPYDHYSSHKKDTSPENQHQQHLYSNCGVIHKFTNNWYSDNCKTVHTHAYTVFITKKTKDVFFLISSTQLGNSGEILYTVYLIHLLQNDENILYIQMHILCP